jgi:chloramphenicol-sensitive protein RarD
MTPHREQTTGVALGTLAYGTWGVIPLYWKRLGHVGPGEILAHRVLGALIVGIALLAGTGGLRGAAARLTTPSSARALVASTALIAANWGLFIWAVVTGHLAEASLGYFINPLLNALLGRLVLGERLSRGQVAAIGSTALGVVWLTLTSERPPWVALALAASFALYGLIRKRAQAGAIEGFAIEALLVSPIALGFLLTRTPTFGAMATGDGATRLLLLGAGVVTAVPLIAFASAARRLRYTTLGMLQFLAPTLQLGCAVWLFGEPFSARFALAFAAIGLGAALFVADALRRERLGTAAA